MAKETFSIPNISCGHCTRAIHDELKEVDGVAEVDGHIEAKTVTVSWESPATREIIINTLKEINYPAENP